MDRLEKAFIDAFTRQVEHYGFAKRKATRIYKQTPLGKCGVRFGFRKVLYGYDVTMYLFVRIDEIERLSNLFPPNPLWKETSTLDTELGVLTTGETKVWSLNLSENEGSIGNIFLRVLDDIGAPKSSIATEVDTVLDRAVESFETFGLPFFDKYSESVAEVLRLTTEDSKEARQLVGSPEISAQKAIAAAYILGDVHLFEETTSHMQRVLTQQYPGAVEDFKMLKAHLKALAPDVNARP